MEKLTLSIHDKEKIERIKVFAKTHNTSVSQLFEKYIDALLAFDQSDIKLSSQLKSLKQPGKRPTQKEIESHLKKRRSRSAPKK